MIGLVNSFRGAVVLEWWNVVDILVNGNVALNRCEALIKVCGSDAAGISGVDDVSVEVNGSSVANVLAEVDA